MQVQLRVIGKRVKSDTVSVDNVSHVQHEQYWAKDSALSVSVCVCVCVCVYVPHNDQLGLTDFPHNALSPQCIVGTYMCVCVCVSVCVCVCVDNTGQRS